MLRITHPGTDIEYRASRAEWEDLAYAIRGAATEPLAPPMIDASRILDLLDISGVHEPRLRLSTWQRIEEMDNALDLTGWTVERA